MTREKRVVTLRMEVMNDEKNEKPTLKNED
jgi:hypothetical protein